VNARRPNCGATDSESVDRRHDADREVVVEFARPACDHGWTVSL